MFMFRARHFTGIYKNTKRFNAPFIALLTLRGKKLYIYIYKQYSSSTKNKYAPSMSYVLNPQFCGRTVYHVPPDGASTSSDATRLLFGCYYDANI